MVRVHKKHILIRIAVIAFAAFMSTAVYSKDNTIYERDDNVEVIVIISKKIRPYLEAAKGLKSALDDKNNFKAIVRKDYSFKKYSN